MYSNYLFLVTLTSTILFIPSWTQLLISFHSQSFPQDIFVTDSSETTINVALTTNPVRTNNCSTISPLGSSDHFGLFASIDLIGPRPKPNIPWKIWRYNHALPNDLLCELDSDSIIVKWNPNATWINWQNSFLEIMHTCIPRSSLSKRKNLPWLSKQIIQLMRKRNMYFTKSKTSPSYASRYKELHNMVISKLCSTRSTISEPLSL